MTFQIIIRGRERQQARLKGKTITELAKNLESQGYPTEFSSEEIRDRVKREELRNERPLNRKDCAKIATEIGVNREKQIAKIARERGCTYVPEGYVDRDDNGNIIIRK